MSHLDIIPVQSNLDLIKKNEDELRIHVVIRIDGLLKDIDVIQDVLDDLILVILDVFGHVALQETVVGLD